MKYKRTVKCNLTIKDLDKEVIINGWVNRIRNFGNIYFLTIRDRYGLIQVKIDTDQIQEMKDLVSELSYEYVIAVFGVVKKRPFDMINKDMESGEIEIIPKEIRILNKSLELPFMILDKTEAKEETRLKYRYLDLRSTVMQQRIKLRNDFTFKIREYLQKRDFLEIETPSLIRSTPEGARDFVVPSRTNNKFWALPQSPQLFKQLLMIGGFDKYFQIAHCFRDEDARGDRQAEHTQIDMELSFVEQEDIFCLVENLMQNVFKETIFNDLDLPFLRIDYYSALNKYGSDKPDLRYDLEIIDLTENFKDSNFKVFQDTIKNKGCIKALKIENQANSYSRKKLDELSEIVKVYKAKGLAYIKYEKDNFDSGISKFLNEEEKEDLKNKMNLQNNDLVVFIADLWKIACLSMGALRIKLAKDLNLYNKEFAFCWVYDFPLFSFDKEKQIWEAEHHLFTMPKEEYIDTIEQDPGSIKGQLYDLVLNGYEIASGSIRIHQEDIQKRIFNVIGLNQEQAEQKFGFFLNALKYGAPPHGGIALGLDRIIMILSKQDSIKEVIAFPKTNTSYNPLDNSPSEIDIKQLKELNLILKEDEI